MQIFLVGGAVRDQLLGRPVTERDWVVIGATPEQMLALGFQQVGRDFPVFLHPTTKEEYALARTERKTGKGYKGFTVSADTTVTLEEDLYRRDITINAMAMTENGELIDPFGGHYDLSQKQIRHVSEAFIEDPVRVLRIARFMARYYHLGFTIAPDTFALMQDMVKAGEIDHLIPERVWQELYKALQEKHPSLFISTLRDCGALAVILPEVDQLYGVPNPPKWHPEIDTGIHTHMVVDAAAKLSPLLTVRFAALVHDLGKGLTPRQYWPSHHGHEEKGVHLIEALCQRLKIPNEFKQLGVLVSRYHGMVHRVFECKADTLLNLFEKTDAFRRSERFEAFLLACMADFRGRTTFEHRPYPQLDYLSKALSAANSVSTQPLIDQGLCGLELATALKEKRIEAIHREMAS
ncbi:MAG: multifunctional CCA addition/repair protein [Legionellales bacterium]|nr:multifunctional CCA addition/repair protein [Legionellales bacterium]